MYIELFRHNSVATQLDPHAARATKKKEAFSRHTTSSATQLSPRPRRTRKTKTSASHQHEQTKTAYGHQFNSSDLQHRTRR